MPITAFRGLLVTTAVIGTRQDRAGGRAGRQARRTRSSCVDDRQNVRDINDAARHAAASRSSWRSICSSAAPASRPASRRVELAQLIDSLPNVTFAGLQSYDGAAAHTTPFDARSARTTTTMGKAVETRAMIERAGIACPLVTGGSTGTYRFDSENPGITELQPGSFVFMDMEYGTIGGPDGSDYRDFKNALTVVTTVVSRPPGMAIVDGGYKAFSTDRPFTPQPVGIDGVTYGWAGDEHGRLDVSQRVARSEGRRSHRVHPAAHRSHRQSLRFASTPCAAIGSKRSGRSPREARSQ